MKQTGDFEGRVCVITGAGRGIGAVTAKRLAAGGGRLAILDLDPETAEETARELRDGGADARAYAVDVTAEDQVIAAAEAVRADFGGVDVLINNAGICPVGPTLTFPLETWQRTIDIMVTGVFLCSREFAKVLRDGGGGAIVNLSSLNGLVVYPMRLAYSAAKAAVISMTQVLASEWAGYGIRVNAVAPGNTRTAMVQDLVEDGTVDLDAYLQQTPLKRLADPEEIAEAIAYLASGRASFVTGEVLVIDGGWSSFGWIPWSGDPESPELAR